MHGNEKMSRIPLLPMPTTESGGVGAWEPFRLDAADWSNLLSLRQCHERNLASGCCGDVQWTGSTKDERRVHAVNGVAGDRRGL